MLGCYRGALSEHMISNKAWISKEEWTSYVDRIRERRKILVEKTFAFLLCVIPFGFHRTLVELKERTIEQIDSARLPTLIRLNGGIKSIIGGEWTGELEAVLVGMNTR